MTTSKYPVSHIQVHSLAIDGLFELRFSNNQKLQIYFFYNIFLDVVDNSYAAGRLVSIN